MTLYRPVGQGELDLIRESDFRVFPPRLPHQPIFYPVLEAAYAAQIAHDWNTKDAASGFVGYVTRFAVRADFLARYPVQTAGARIHREYWIPSEEFDECNRTIVGTIDVIEEYRHRILQPSAKQPRRPLRIPHRWQRKPTYHHRAGNLPMLVVRLARWTNRGR